MGKAVKKVASVATPAGRAFSIGSKLLGGKSHKDLLFGKEVGGVSASPIAGDIFATQREALGLQRSGLKQLKGLTGEGAGKRQAGLEAERQKKFAVQGAKDARRRIQQLSAQRGLQRSSIGMRQQNLANIALSERMGDIEANRLRREREIALENARLRLGGGSDVVRSQNLRVPLQDIQGQRRGGLLNVLTTGAGAGIGGVFGGAGGAAAGGQIGSGIGSSLQGVFG